MIGREIGRRDGWNVCRGKQSDISRRKAEATLASVVNGLFHFDCLLPSRWEIKLDLLSTPETCYFDTHLSAAAPTIDTAFSTHFLTLSLLTYVTISTNIGCLGCSALLCLAWWQCSRTSC